MSDKELVVYRDTWNSEHVALICGIANAGGGALIVTSTDTSRVKGMKRLRKPFEQIPQIAQRELGLTCITQPVLEGSSLCLEVVVPASKPEKPLRYKSAFWFYDGESERNLALSAEEVRQRRREASESATVPAGGAHAASPVPVATSTDDLFQMFSDLVGRLATMDGGPTVRHEGGSFVVEFPTRALEASPSRPAPKHAKGGWPPDFAEEDEPATVASSGLTAGAATGAAVGSEAGSVAGSVAGLTLAPISASTAGPASASSPTAAPAAAAPATASAASAAPSPTNSARLAIRPVNPEASEFSQRSLAAANGLDLTSSTEYVLRVLQTNGRVTAPRIAEVLGVSESTVRRSFKQLKELGLIERVGSDKAGYWRVLA